MRSGLILSLMCFAANAMAQITIGASTPIRIKGDLATVGGLINRSTETDISDASLFLVGPDAALSSETPIALSSFTVDADGVFSLAGDWTITRDLLFTRGILEPTGKLVYSGSTTLEASEASYISGQLTQKGAGVRFFPVGTRDAYFPMSLNDVENPQEEITVRVVAAAPALTAPEGISSIAADRYWEVSPASAARAATASLYSKGSALDGASNVVVVQGDASAGAVADNLKGGTSKDFVTSFLRVTKPVLALGVASDPELRIHDLITPHNLDDVNDKLKIVNIESTYSNTVYLLDRYGVLIRKWQNFRNYDDPENTNPDSFDFTRLSPGNYICMLEYKLSADGGTEKLTQMITILKEK